MKKTLILLSAVLVLISSACEPKLSRADRIAAQILDPTSDYVIVVSHRGDWRNSPENSLQSIESVIAMGADMMELDLKMTLDSVLVLSHDASVERCTDFNELFAGQPDKSPKVCDLTFDEIRFLRLKNPEGEVMPDIQIPTLREALECCKDRICVNVDQGWWFYDQVLQISEELGCTNQILIKGKSSIAEVKEKLSSHEAAMMYMPVIDLQRPAGLELFHDYLQQEDAPLAYEVCWFTNDSTYKDEPVAASFDEAAAAIRKQGAKIWVNTMWGSLCGGVGNEDETAFNSGDPGTVYQQYLDKGVTMIQTDRPEMLVKWLESQGRHNLK